MYDFLVWLGHAYALYRASQDSGSWWLQLDNEARQTYMESYLITKGLL